MQKSTRDLLMKNSDDLAREQQNNWKELNEQHRRSHKEFMDDFQAKMEKFDRDLEHSRALSRNLIEKIIVLATSIVGVSITVLSVEQLKISLDSSTLMVSWRLFALTIALGLLIPFIESRAKYVIFWRSLQPQEFEKRENSIITRAQRLRVLLVTTYGIFINPRSLIYCRPEEDAKKHHLDKVRNCAAIHQANLYINLTFVLELIFIATFVFGLVLLIASVQL
jgi:hypothetical protein